MSRIANLGRRLPLESGRPWVVFAFCRLGVVLVILAALVVLGFPFDGELTVAMAIVALPWALFMIWLSLKHPAKIDNPLVAAGDMLVIGVLETVEPDIYGAARFLAISFLAIHAHLQGERNGVLVALSAAVLLVVPTAVTDRAPVDSDRLIFLEAVFIGTALMTVILVGRFRTAESGARLEARAVTRRAFETEDEVRRDLADSLHDGPIQELIGLEMELAALESALERGDSELSGRIVADARRTVERNVRALREGIISLGPAAFEEMSYEAAVERALPTWTQRYGCQISIAIEPLSVGPDLEGDLFRVTQEAISNSCRHGEARHVDVGLRVQGRTVELSVADDGRGFNGTAPSEPGHIGVASMRERVSKHGGELRLESEHGAGTTLTVRVPLPASGKRKD